MPSSEVTIIHRCDEYVGVNKPADMRIDGGRRDEKKDDANVLGELKRLLPQEALRHCHQLDFATSGCMLYALSKKAAGEAGKLFEARSTVKEYLALVWGHVMTSLRCDDPICQDPNDDFKMTIGDLNQFHDRKRRRHSGPALTFVDVIQRGSYTVASVTLPVTKVRLRPQTGRRHQLRLHCCALGYPIVGDATYSDDLRSPRMMLHAVRLLLPFRHRPPLTLETPDPFLEDSLPGLVFLTDADASPEENEQLIDLRR